MAERKEKKGRNYIWIAISGILIIWVVKTFWPKYIPIDTWSVWESRGTIGDWLKVAWPIFAWGVGIKTFFTYTRDDAFQYDRPSGSEVWIRGTLNSLWAGITEEIAFRWLIFLSLIATIQLGNFLFFGFLGFGFPEWFHNHIWGPLANWITFQKLDPYIFSESGWFVGAAMLTSNAFFRDGHKYQGLFGIINSWFMGMFFFWIMFNHGLWAAMLIHFLYDFLIFTYVAIYIGIRNILADRRRRRRLYEKTD